MPLTRSLRPYRGFTTTASRSASVPRIGTQPLRGFSRLGRSLSPARSGRSLSGHAFSCSARPQQIRLTSSSCRTAWPVSGHPPGSSRDSQNTRFRCRQGCFDTSATIRLRSSSRSLPDHSSGACSSSLTTTVFSQRGMRRLEASPQGWSDGWFDADFVAEGFELADVGVLAPFGVGPLAEEAAALAGIAGIGIRQQVPDAVGAGTNDRHGRVERQRRPAVSGTRLEPGGGSTAVALANRGSHGRNEMGT
jgi:hypothetical protein